MSSPAEMSAGVARKLGSNRDFQSGLLSARGPTPLSGLSLDSFLVTAILTLWIQIPGSTSGPHMPVIAGFVGMPVGQVSGLKVGLASAGEALAAAPHRQ